MPIIPKGNPFMPPPGRWGEYVADVWERLRRMGKLPADPLADYHFDTVEEENEYADDFTPVIEGLVQRARHPVFVLYWSTVNGSYTQEYFDLRRAEDHWLALRDSVSAQHASIRQGDQELRRYDYDPYAWHDVRKAVGR